MEFYDLIAHYHSVTRTKRINAVHRALCVAKLLQIAVFQHNPSGFSLLIFCSNKMGEMSLYALLLFLDHQITKR